MVTRKADTLKLSYNYTIHCLFRKSEFRIKLVDLALPLKTTLFFVPFYSFSLPVNASEVKLLTISINSFSHLYSRNNK